MKSPYVLRIISVLFVVSGLAVAGCMGCRVQPVPPETGPAPTAPAAEPEKEPAKALRIVCFAPHITEVVFALGQGDRVVGVTDFCDYPPEIAGVEKVGGYMQPAFEKLTVLAPDMILLQGDHQKVAEFAETQGILVVHVAMDSIATIDEGIAIIGKALGCDAEADRLRSQIKADLEAVGAAVAKAPRCKTLIITSRMEHDLNSLYTVGGSSFVSELVALAGGDNIYADAEQPYLEASKETVVMRGPEAIIEFHAGEDLTETEAAQYVADWGDLPTLPAVQAGRIHLITPSFSLRPGPRVALIARLLASELHPDVGLSEP